MSFLIFVVDTLVARVYCPHVLDTEALRNARHEAGLSRERLAGMVGRSLSTILRWESGAAQPNAADLVRLRAALAVPSVDALLLQCA